MEKRKAAVHYRKGDAFIFHSVGTQETPCLEYPLAVN